MENVKTKTRFDIDTIISIVVFINDTGIGYYQATLNGNENLNEPSGIAISK